MSNRMNVTDLAFAIEPFDYIDIDAPQPNS
jgi:hypothetical protein